jgi:trigger factor
MQESIKVEELSSTEYKVSINLPADIVDKKFDDFFASVKNKAQIPGFRQGKAPIAMLKQHFGLKARAPVAGMLVSEYYDKALKDNTLNPIGQPTIKDFTPSSDYPGKFGFDNSFTVELTIEVVPKLDPVGYKELELEMFDVDEKMLTEHHMNEYRDRFAVRTQVTDRGANLGDTLVIDFVGYLDNVKFEGGEAKGFAVDKLGQANFIPGFEEQILGMRTGETKKIFVTFPQEYHAKHLAGKNATFDVTVNNIVSSKLAEENDDLALMAGLTTIDELREKINQDVQKEKRLLLRQHMDQQVISKLLEKNEFVAPKSLVDQELKHIMSRIKVEKIQDEFVAELRKNAEFNVKRAIIANAIYDKEDAIEVTPEELDMMLGDHAAQSKKTKDELISALYNSGQMDSFVGVLRFAKVIDFILDNAKRQEKGSEEQK